MSSYCPLWRYYVILSVLLLVNSVSLFMFVTKFKQYFSSILYRDCGIVPILILQDAANVILWILSFKLESLDFAFGNVLFMCKQILSSFFALLLLFIYPVQLWLPLVMLKCVLSNLSTMTGHSEKGQSSSAQIQFLVSVPILLASLPILKLTLDYVYRGVNFSGLIILLLFLCLHISIFLPDHLDRIFEKILAPKRSAILGKDMGILTVLRTASNSLGPIGIVRIAVLTPVLLDIPAIVFYAMPSTDLIHLSCFLFACNVTSVISALMVAFSHSEAMLKFSSVAETCRNLVVFITVLSSVFQDGSPVSIFPVFCACSIIFGCGILSVKRRRHSSMLDPLN